MDHKINVLLAIGLMFYHITVNAFNISEQRPNNDEKWSFSKEFKAQFITKQSVNYLVVKNAKDKIVAEQLIPRAQTLNNINWSSNEKYLTFTKNDESLWLFNVEDSAVTLVDHKFQHKTPLSFNVKWSPNGQWVQYLSSNNAHYLAKVYSLQRKRSYIVPVASGLISDIAWHDVKNELVINTVQATEEQTEMSLYDIKMTVKPDEQLVKLN
ncbi:hypothetical protein [Thalassotalea sediminis]|uniref:hypothetical protein n=1 Tax=Thalassotalea sediminis TaxID=1759089 RepID=UPI00257291C7|nr:hypothetical protein [Thalassotalea sediminis]